MTAFKQVLTNLQAGQREEAMIGLEFVLRLDPNFAPAMNLKRQLASSSDEIDLGDIIAQLQAPTTEAINGLLIEAVDNFNSREFLAAKEQVEKVLIDLPGHQEARELRDQIDKALKIENQVGQFLIQAREALGTGDPQEAANFVMMAQALDPHHTGIASTLKEIDDTGGLALSQESPGADPQAPVDEPSPTIRPATIGGDPAFETGGVAVPEPPEAPPELTPTPDGEQEDAFAVEFDTQDPFADLIDPAPDPAFEEPAADPGSADGGAVAFPPMDDTADLFTAPRQASAPGDPAADGVDPGTAPGGAADGDSVANSIRELIEKGTDAFDRGDEPLAISLWSRVFLVRPNHPEAGHLIVKAKKKLAESESQVEELLGKARDAFDEHEFEAATLLVTKALTLRPNHLEVTVLKEELEREQGPLPSQPQPDAEPAPAASAERAETAEPELPELDDDLFGDVLGDDHGDAVEETDSDVDALDQELFDDDDFEDFEVVSLSDRLRDKLPMRTLAIAAVALVVVLAGVWLGGRFLSSEPEIDDSAAVSEVLVEADRLFKENKAEEALHLLREFPSSGLSQQRIDMRIAKYEESLAPPTPTPVPEHATRAQNLLDQGLWWSAYMTASDGLETHPDDPGLLELRALIVDNEPEAAVLESALGTGDFRTTVSITEDLLLQYPQQGDLTVVLERSLFNAALAESRAYNLTGAENHLTRLLELKPEDEEAIRFLEFVQKYKVRAADMRLEIFIRSMDER